VSSLIFRYPPLAKVLQALQVETTVTDACAHSTKKFGERHLKQFKIVSLGTWGLRVNQRCRCPGGVHVPLMVHNESGAISGTPAMKASQAYPTKLGETVVAAWLAGDVDPQELAQTKKSRKSKRKAEGQLGQPASSSTGRASWQRPVVPDDLPANNKANKQAHLVVGQVPSWLRPAPP